MIDARRHAQQGPPGRQRDPRRLAGRRQGGRGRGRPAAVAPPRRRGRARAARADDERAQRRRARRQQGRLPGVHGGARWARRRSPRPCARAPRCSTRSRRRCTTAASAPRWATRAASRPTSSSNEAALAGADRRASRPPATRPGEDVAIALDPATSEIHDGRRLPARARGPRPVARGDGGLLGRDGGPLPDRLDRGRHGRGGLGRLEGAHRARSATACSSWATTCS